jgi:hypothetical protein
MNKLEKALCERINWTESLEKAMRKDLRESLLKAKYIRKEGNKYIYKEPVGSKKGSADEKPERKGAEIGVTGKTGENKTVDREYSAHEDLMFKVFRKKKVAGASHDDAYNYVKKLVNLNMPDKQMARAVYSRFVSTMERHYPDKRMTA